MILPGYELLTDKNLDQVEEKLKNTDNPKDIKMDLALEIVATFDGQENAEKAKENWTTQFSKKEIPDNLEEFSFESGVKIMEILKEIGFVKSNAEAKRKIDEGAVQIDGEKITDYFAEIQKGEKILKLGKKMAKIIIL